MNILEANELNKIYKGFQLKDISFQLDAGDIMGLIGENGAGKTTTIKILLNLISSDNGSCTFFGKDIKKHEVELKQDIAVILDDNHFHGLFNVKDIAKIMAPIYINWSDTQFYQYIDSFSLPIKKPIKEFSKGMKVKLNFAVALSHKPRLLILDEATSGLDPIMRLDMLDVLKEYIKTFNGAVLFSTHILSDIERIANKVTFLHKGEVIFSDYKKTIESLHSTGTKKATLEAIMESYIRGGK